jgi:hypothetical protein
VGLDISRIEQRKEESSKSSGDRFKFKDGKPNRIRLFSFKHKVTPDDVKNGYFPKEKLGKVVEEADRPVTIHFGVAKDNRPCMTSPELVKQSARLLASKAEQDQKRGKDMAPQTKYAVNIVDTEERDPVTKGFKMRHVMLPKSVYNSMLGCLADTDYGPGGEKLLGCKARDFVISFNSKAKGSDMYKVQVRDAANCKPIPPTILAEVKDFYTPEGFLELGILPAPGAEAASEEEAVEETAEEEVTEEAVEETAEETPAEEEETPAEESESAEDVPAEEENVDLETEEEPAPPPKKTVAKPPVKGAVTKKK